MKPEYETIYTVEFCDGSKDKYAIFNETTITGYIVQDGFTLEEANRQVVLLNDLYNQIRKDVLAHLEKTNNGKEL